MQPVALKRCARVLAGRLPAKRLPARTRGRRWLHLIFKDHKFVEHLASPDLCAGFNYVGPRTITHSIACNDV